MNAPTPSSPRRLLLFLAGLLLLAAPGEELSAQERAFPYHMEEGAWVWPSMGAGLTALGWYLRGTAQELEVKEIRGLDPGTVNVFDRGATRNWSPTWAHRSDAFRGSVFGAAALLLGGEAVHAMADGRSDDAVTLGAMFGEAALLTAGATYLTKVVAGRRRPFLYNEDLSVEERYLIASTGSDKPTMSFFSGHASAAFAAATFSSTVFQNAHGTSALSHLVWGSTLSLATLTAYARVKAGVHFPSDVIVGALVGGTIGYLIPSFHEVDEGEEDRNPDGGFMLSYAIRF
jgi:membrane-associated phospholipid phosphatase